MLTAFVLAGALHAGVSMKWSSLEPSDLPKALVPADSVFEAIRLRDSRGLQYAVISGQDRGQHGTPDFSSRLNAVGYLATQGGFQRIWSAKDFNPNPLTRVTCQTGTLKATDWYSDGLAEVSFSYSLNADGADPFTQKMLAFEGNKKYAIRGTIPVSSDEMERYTKTQSPAKQKADKVVLDSMSSAWDRYVRTFDAFVTGEN